MIKGIVQTIPIVENSTIEIVLIIVRKIQLGNRNLHFWYDPVCEGSDYGTASIYYYSIFFDIIVILYYYSIF